MYDNLVLNDKILSFLENITMTTPDTVGKSITDDFPQQCIEKNFTRKNIVEKANVALANVTRFEQKGEISLYNLLWLAIAVNYTFK